MDTKQLRYFISVAEHRSFTKAAQEFYLTQSAITHRISALENELGTSLFSRTTRSVSLTDAGRLYLEYAKQMVAQEEKVLKNLNELKDTAALRLKIGYLSAPCRHFLPRLITDYQTRYPDVKVDLVREHANGLLNLAKEMDFDLLFSVCSDLQKLSDYTYQKLNGDDYYLVCAPEHPCLEDGQIQYDRLSEETFLFLSKESGSFMYQQSMQVMHALGIVPHSIREYPQLQDVLFALQCGIGISILPGRVKDYLCGELAFFPLPGSSHNIDLGVAWNRQVRDPAVFQFLDLMNIHPADAQA